MALSSVLVPTFRIQNIADSWQWKAFRFFDVTQVKLSQEENALLSEVRFHSIHAMQYMAVVNVFVAGQHCLRRNWIR